jgi:hypothetical protein
MNKDKYEIDNSIIIKKFKRISPTLLGKQKYVGAPDYFDFERLNDKYYNLQNSLEHFNTKFDYIWCGVGDEQATAFTKGKYFIVKSEDDIFVWVYDSLIGYSTSHKLYINGKPISIIKWLKMSNIEQEEYYSLAILKIINQVVVKKDEPKVKNQKNQNVNK